MTVKNPNTKTIEISTEAYDKLHSIKTELETIFNAKMSFDKVIKLLTNPKIIDYSEMNFYGKEKTTETPKE